MKVGAVPPCVKFAMVQALPVQVQVVLPPVCVAETNVIFVIVPSETLAFVTVTGNPTLVFVTVTAKVTLLPTVTKELFAGEVMATVSESVVVIFKVVVDDATVAAFDDVTCAAAEIVEAVGFAFTV